MSWLSPFFQSLIYLVYFSPIFLAILLWQIYLLYIRSNYIKDEERILLGIKIPKEITKSPRAMELLLEVFYQTYEGELIDRFIKGSIRGWFSLELVSIGGKIHFYLQIPKFFKNIVEARIYSQYPEVEIFEAEDYTKEVTFGQPDSPWDIKGWEYGLKKDDAYPIKTYIDYEMEKDPKEEFKIDPMTPLLEFLSSIKPSERVWIQIMIMAGKERFAKYEEKEKDWFFFKTKHNQKKMVDWKDSGEALVKKLSGRGEEKDMAKAWTKTILTKSEQEMVTAIQRNLAKLSFDVGIRSIYAATEEIKPAVGVGLNSAFKQFGSDKLNSFKPSLQTGFNNPWQDPWGWRTRKKKNDLFKYYCNRSFFYPPAGKKPIGLTTEELATIYHFPGQVATTPSLERIQSKRGEPPANLPI